MLSVADALARVLAPLHPLSTETVSLDQAAGRVLAADAVASRAQPPNDVSAMDGYAVRAADIETLPVTLKQIGDVPAGAAFDGAVGAGECTRIFTGATLPQGADTVIMQENTHVTDDGTIEIRDGNVPGRHVRKKGTDFDVGTVGVKAGKRLTGRDISLLAAMNLAEVIVTRRPKIAILATGDELVHPGESPGPDQIISSTPPALAALINKWGGDPIHLGIARDTEESLRNAVKGADNADMLLTIGGASVGDHDLIQKVLGQDGLNVDFWKIAMKPGKPMIFGDWKGMPFLGLPGNPVSSLVCAQLFLKPMIRKLIGEPHPEDSRKTVAALLSKPMRDNGPRQDYVRAKVTTREDGVLIASPFGLQDSAVLSVLSEADGLIVRPPHCDASNAGAIVQVLLLD